MKFSGESAAVLGGYLSASYTSTGGVSKYDWIGLFIVGQVIVSTDGSEALWWQYVSQSSSSGTISTYSRSGSSRWTVPASGGPYEFRYFCCDGVSVLGKSAPMSLSTSSISGNKPGHYSLLSIAYC